VSVRSVLAVAAVLVLSSESPSVKTERTQRKSVSFSPVSVPEEDPSLLALHTQQHRLHFLWKPQASALSGIVVVSTGLATEARNWFF
jgi:hypothetical protein